MIAMCLDFVMQDITLVLWLLDAILTFADPSHANFIVSFFKGWRMMFLGAMTFSNECRTCLIREEQGDRDSHTKCAKNLQT